MSGHTVIKPQTHWERLDNDYSRVRSREQQMRSGDEKWGRLYDDWSRESQGNKVGTTLGSHQVGLITTTKVSLRSDCDLTDGIYMVTIAPDRYCSYQIMNVFWGNSSSISRCFLLVMLQLSWDSLTGGIMHCAMATVINKLHVNLRGLGDFS